MTGNVGERSCIVSREDTVTSSERKGRYSYAGESSVRVTPLLRTINLRQRAQFLGPSGT